MDRVSQSAVIGCLLGLALVVTACGLGDDIDVGDLDGRMVDVDLVEVAMVDERGGARFTVGLTLAGAMCVEVGSVGTLTSTCGGDDFGAAAGQFGNVLVVAGYVAEPVGAVTIVTEGKQRLPSPIAPIDGHDAVAFGMIIASRPAFVEVHVVDEAGDVVVRHFPSIQQG